MEVSDLPKHIAIIMDGNRRWAKERNLPSGVGHKEGAETMEKIVRYANKIGIKYLTVYAFSTENWKRSKEEVDGLMLLLQNRLDSFAKRASTSNIKINVIGNTSELSSGLQKSIQNAINKTAENTGTCFNVAFNYGGRAELVRATKLIAEKVKTGELNIDDITEDTIQNNLYTAGMPDPDLLIRTAYELRTSNFLPWQIVYSEFYFTKKYWPEFSEEDLDLAIEEFKRRNRKFGGK